MKTIMKCLLVVSLMGCAVGNTWGVATIDLPADAYNVVQGKLYDADGEVVGHVRVSWHKRVDLGYSFPCSLTIRAKVKLQKVDPSTTYEGRILVECKNVSLIGEGGIMVETNPGGAGTGEVVFGLLVLDKMPDCIVVAVSSPSGKCIKSGFIALVH